LPARKIGSRLFVARSDLAAFLEREGRVEVRS